MDLTLSVKTVLKDLGLSDYSDTFNKEEVSYVRNIFLINLSSYQPLQINLAAFFTLSDEDLITIGVNDISDRKKILEFINDFKTPEKPKKLQPKNFLHRYWTFHAWLMLVISFLTLSHKAFRSFFVLYVLFTHLHSFFLWKFMFSNSYCNSGDKEKRYKFMHVENKVFF